MLNLKKYPPETYSSLVKNAQPLFVDRNPMV